MYAYYLERGHDLNYLLNLNMVEKSFFMAAMEFNIEHKQSLLSFIE